MCYTTWVNASKHAVFPNRPVIYWSVSNSWHQLVMSGSLIWLRALFTKPQDLIIKSHEILKLQFMSLALSDHS